MPESRVRQLLKFVRVFGTFPGLRLWCSLLWQMGTGRAELTLRLPAMAAPIHLRRRDLPIFWQIMVMRENDFDTLPQAARIDAMYRSIQAEGHTPVIVDCGGHVGLSALWFASRFPNAKVYSIEPDSSNFKLLTTNAATYGNIVPLNGGVWSRPCTLRIANPNSGSASFQLEEVSGPDEAAGLRGYSIDEVFQSEAENRLLLVKIDVEGAESEVFQGPTDWLGRTATVVIELHDWLLPGQGTSKSFFKRISEYNFDVVLRGENLLLFRV